MDILPKASEVPIYIRWVLAVLLVFSMCSTIIFNYVSVLTFQAEMSNNYSVKDAARDQAAMSSRLNALSARINTLESRVDGKQERPK